MKGYIGTCTICNKKIYCNDGFLDGVHEQGRLYCFTCAEEQSTEYEYNQNELIKNYSLGLHQSTHLYPT